MPYPPFIYVNEQTLMGGQFISELARLAFLIIMCVEVKFPTNEKYIGINVSMDNLYQCLWAICSGRVRA